MRHSARLTAGIIAAIALVTVSAAGCTKDKNDKDFKSDSGAVTTSVTMPATGGESSGATETKMATRDGGEIPAAADFLAKYTELGGESGPLGKTIGPERTAPGGGKMQEFDGGTLYFSPATGTHVVWGEIAKAWEEQGGPAGALGYPTSDEVDVNGGKQSEFTGGSIAWVDGVTTVTRK